MQVFIICVYRSNLALLIRLCVKVPCGRCEFMSSWGLTICSIPNYQSFMIILLHHKLVYIMQSSIWNFMHSTIHSNGMVFITGPLFKCSECRALAICLGVDLSKDPFPDTGSNQTGHRKKNTACGFYSIFIS